MKPAIMSAMAFPGMDMWVAVPLSIYFILVYFVPIWEKWKPSWCYRASLWLVGLIYLMPSAFYFLLFLATAIGFIYPLLVIRIGCGNQACFWFHHLPVTKMDEKLNYSHLECERCGKNLGNFIYNIRK